MLSLAPAAVGYFELDMPGKVIFDDASIIAGTGIGSAVVAGAQGITPQGISLETRSWNLFLPPITPEVQPVLPYQPPGGGTPPSAGTDAPPWGLPYRPLPPSDSPDPYAPGGMMDIGDLDGTAPGGTAPGVFADVVSDREVFAVLELLSALKYRPDNFHNESASQADASAVHADYEAPVTTVVGERPAENLSEGGMVALAVDALFAKTAESDPIVEIETWLDVPVQMESAYGKFQAFEVSTTEAQPPLSATNASGARTNPPNQGAAEAPPAAGVESTSEVLLPIEGHSGEIQAPVGLTQEEAQFPAAAPRGSNANTSSSLKAAALALYLAYAARAARRPSAEESHDDPSLTMRYASRRNPIAPG